MLFQRTVTPLTCPNRQHRKSAVDAWGTRLINRTRYQRYRCRGRSGTTHTFSVVLESPATSSVRLPSSWQPPPPCPSHDGGRVVRDGFYGGKSERRRQRYRCEHDSCVPACKTDCAGHHRFTPPLPRGKVAVGHGFADVCDVCEEPLGIHHGAPAAARRHTYTSRNPCSRIRSRCAPTRSFTATPLCSM